jgi:ABC-2 type transport system ATP-binding protein
MHASRMEPAAPLGATGDLVMIWVMRDSGSALRRSPAVENPAPLKTSPASGGTAAIEVRDLRKRYGDVEAVRGIDFGVRQGEIFGLLGPNGAGKTTTVEILEGYRERSDGTVSVLGFDPQDRPRELRERVGIVLQSTGLYPHITVREALEHFAGFYPHPRDVEEVLALSGLEAKAGERTRRLSGGQQRRLDFALALIGDPDLIFLDEPTTGFDPAARRAAWDTIRALRDLGKTVLLTTHYLDEAQTLADRVAIIKDGRILAAGSPAELGVEGTASYRVSWRDAAGERHEREIEDPTAFLHELTGDALARGDRVRDLVVVRPSLEDVYLQLTADSPLDRPSGDDAAAGGGGGGRRRRGRRR